MIRIKQVEHYGDATSKYEVTTDCKTVGDFITEWLAYMPREWGHFGIKCTESPFFGDPYCEYRYGRIIGTGLPDYILDREIDYVEGNGGWSLSDFQFALKPFEEECENGSPTYCSDCTHYEVCGCEGYDDPAMNYCKNKQVEKTGQYERLASGVYKCSECGYILYTEYIDEYSYCNHCGTKMDEYTKG